MLAHEVRKAGQAHAAAAYPMSFKKVLREAVPAETAPGIAHSLGFGFIEISGWDRIR